jgi:uncharacterized protein YbbC (DUF1343 family)
MKVSVHERGATVKIKRGFRVSSCGFRVFAGGEAEPPFPGRTPVLVAAASLLLVFCSEVRLERIRPGADQVLEEPYLTWIRGKRIGLITNQTGVVRDLRPLHKLLSDHPEVELAALFAPEHGLFGQAQAGEKVAGGADFFSLYGDHRAPTPEMLSNIDVLVYDIQDVGARFYTYISTMLECMGAASRQGIPFVVLDRPNPIDGRRVEGPVLERGFESFVGIHPIPIRYGMTAGELALLFKKENSLDLTLWIVPVKGWRRSATFEATGLEWIAPSPNIPTPRTADLYPGMCLFEGTNLSEGRGTTKPFELVGAPWLKAELLATLLNQAELPGVRFRPQPFTPTFSKYQGESCQGVQVHVTDLERFRPIETALHMLREILNLHPEDFAFRDAAFDRLAGNGWIRRMLGEQRAVEAIVERWANDLEEFRRRREPHLLYR